MVLSKALCNKGMPSLFSAVLRSYSLQLHTERTWCGSDDARARAGQEVRKNAADGSTAKVLIILLM